MEAKDAFDHGMVHYNYNDLPPPPGCPKLTKPVAASSSQSASHPSNRSSAIIGAGGTSRASVSAVDKNQRIVDLLKQRQTALKGAALQAKNGGNVEQAKIYMRSALSLNSMIESAQAGLPVDTSKIPKAPNMANVAEMAASQAAFSGPIISGESCDPPVDMQVELGAATSERFRRRMYSIMTIMFII